MELIVIDDGSRDGTWRVLEHLREECQRRFERVDFRTQPNAGSSATMNRLVSAARGADKRITDAVVFDAFNMPDGTKSIAIAITIVPTDNMSDTDLISLQNAVIKNVETACNARIRDK